MGAPFDARRFAEHARALPLGRPLVVTPRTGSTNDDALAAAREGAPHGALFVTEEQLAGRGRRGNSWLAPPGEGLLFSLVLRPSLRAERAPALALLAGLAVRAAVGELLERAGSSARALVKWPNDVLVVSDKPRKLAGILVESVVRGAELGGVVVGVGLNVGRLGLPSELAESATSLELLGVTVTRERLLADVLDAVAVRLEKLEDPENPLEALVSELACFDALFGLRVEVDDVLGTAAGIDSEGCLKVVDAAGRTNRIVSGHVTLAAVDERTV
jgi:BirA family biotin operon repressor/biotin-[acetyl-CoA-carboxylase] ligase